MGVKIKPKKPLMKKGEAERTKHSVPMPSYGLQNPGKDAFSPSTENTTPTGTRYDYQKDQSIAPVEYEGPSATYKTLGPMAKLHNGPDNKATGSDKNNTSDHNLSQVTSNMVSAVGNGRKKKRKADRKEKREINSHTRKTEGTRLGQWIRKKRNEKLADEIDRTFDHMEKNPQITHFGWVRGKADKLKKKNKI